MRHCFTIAFLMLFMIFLLVSPSLAEYAVVYNTSSLNIRTGPGYEYPITGNAARSEWIDIHSGSGEWSYVTVIRSGKTGYMLNSFLKRASESGEQIGIVTNPSSGGFLNLREYPSYSAKVLGIYYNGAACRILNQSSGWYMVEIDGLLGYFRQEFLTISGSDASTGYVSASNGKPVNMRTGPAMNYSALTSVPNTAAIEVLLKGNGFWQIRYNGISGYMSSAFIHDSGSGGITPTPMTDGYLIVSNPNSGKVNLRAQASLSSKVLTQYNNGVRLEIIDGGLNWCKVYNKSSGLTGYIMTRYTTVYGVPGTPQKTVSNGKSYVNLRSSPSLTAGKVLYKINSGEKVTVLIPGDEWTQVRYADRDGYMMTCFLK